MTTSTTLTAPPVHDSNPQTSRETTPEPVTMTIPDFSQDSLELIVDFAWSKFQNIISEKNGEHLTPLYVQHFRPGKPQLRINSADDTTQLSTGTINNFKISGECEIGGRTIELKPLKRWQTKYNYLSYAFAHPSDPKTPVALSWSASCVAFKTWDFVCFDPNGNAIAKFAANLWNLKQVGKWHFEKSKAALSRAQVDEIVSTGMTIFYIMVCRMNNPLHLLGSVFAKPGKVDAGNQEIELESRKDR